MKLNVRESIIRLIGIISALIGLTVSAVPILIIGLFVKKDGGKMFFKLNSLIKMSIESNNFQLYSIAIVIILMNFPESHIIMFFEDVFLILFGFYQYPKNERLQLVRQ